MSVEQRFWEKVAVDDDGCWLWTGSVVRGYGQLRVSASRGMIKAHRFSAMLHFGMFDRRLMVLHACDEPRCVRPSHLYLGDHAQNMRDRAERGRSHNPNGGMVTCRRGHPFDEENTYWRPDRPGSRGCRACAAARRRVLVP